MQWAWSSGGGGCSVSLALDFALWRTVEEMGQEAGEENGEDDDEVVLVFLGYVGCAAMLAGAAMRALAASAAATAGRMDAISSACGSGRMAAGASLQSGSPWGVSGWHGRAGEAWDCGLHQRAWAGLGSCNLRGCASQCPRGEQFSWAAVGWWGGWALGNGAVRSGRVLVAGRAGPLVGPAGILWRASVARRVWEAAG